MKSENGYNLLNKLKEHISFNLYHEGEFFNKFEYDEELKRYQSDSGYLTIEAVYKIFNNKEETRKIEWI